MDRFGPWTARSTLYESGGVRILQTTDPDWVLKASGGISRETEMVRKLHSYGVRRTVELPDDFWGAGWYAMRRYDGYLTCSEYCRKHWRTFACNILEFLEDLHRAGYAHMDIKKANVLIDRRTNTVVVADYEHIECPIAGLTCDSGANTAWYYMAMGAEWSEPLVGFRMDLMALAYMISDLSAPICRDNPQGNRPFEQACYDRREGDGLPLRKIVALRDDDMAAADPAVQELVRRVRYMHWDARDAPPRSFYTELRALFTETEKPAGPKVDLPHD